MSQEFHERVIGLAERAAAPEMLDQFNETIQIYDSCLVSLDTAEKTANEWNNPKKISDIQSKELAAQQAQAGLDEALTS
nr:hypothetical protein [Nitrosomonas nitrosa]